MKLKRILMIGLSFILLSSNLAFAGLLPEDVEGQSYEIAVEALFERGIITGDVDGLFHPDQTLTRAQACIIVVKSMQPPVDEVSGTATQSPLKSGFPDMSGYSWAEGYIGYAVRHGVTKGYPNGSFKPGNKVTSSELVTMILRASGYTDQMLEGEWPLNYMSKGEELQLYENLPGKDGMPQYATKWMAAQMDYNALPLIEKAIIASNASPYGAPKNLPDFQSSEFMYLGSFDANLTSYGGLPLSRDLQVYTFGDREEYAADMVLSEDVMDYGMDSIYKYKRVISPARYKMSQGVIEELLLPKDAGFTGKVYSVVNSVSNGVNTLTASREITWEYAEGTKPISSSKEYLSGTLYQLTTVDGKILEATRIKDMLDGFAQITDYQVNGPVKLLTDGTEKWIPISTTPTIYVMKDSAPIYQRSNVAAIKPGSQMKLFDVSEDGIQQGDLIIIKE